MSQTVNPTIVVVAYNRLDSLKRLLGSLQKAEYSTNVRIVLSIDGAIDKSNEDILKLCSDFAWSFGEKIIIEHEKNLGIVEHVYSCLDLTSKYEDAILLEDDDYVSPLFYKYCSEVKKFYKDHEMIFGFSLITLQKNGYLNTNFYPIQDGNDVYFAQLGFVHGLMVNKNSWADFKKWYSQKDSAISKKNDNLHQSLLQLDKQKGEWYQTLTKYLVISNKFIAYPKSSLNVNFHEIGEHTTGFSTWYQFPLTFKKEKFVFKEFEESLAIYDSFFELIPEIFKLLNQDLKQYDFEVDLNATKSKDQIKKKYLLSTRKPKRYVKSFNRVMKPLEQNALEKIEGEGIYLAEIELFNFSKLNDLLIRKKNYYFYNEGIKKALLIKFFLIGILYRLKII